MKRNDLLTPEGTRDFLFGECAAKREIVARLTGIFESCGFSEVMTPGLEFYDVFEGKARHFPQETMYKLVDGKNRLMVLRPDNTMPIARLAATRLRDEAQPLRLFYNQSIYMVNPKDSGRDDEISQSGIEIIGGSSESSDYEALYLAAKALSVCDEDYRLEIGDIGIFRELMALYDCDDDKLYENIRRCVETKNYPALDALFGEEPTVVEEAIKTLPRLFGGVEVLDKARQHLKGEAIGKKLSRLEKLCRDLSQLIPADKISVDLGLVHKNNYYTGIIFRGYVEGYGQPALSGGRYDTLIQEFGADSAKAIGFAVNVEAAARVYLKNAEQSLAKTPDILVIADEGCEIEALKACEKLIAEGKSALNFTGEPRESARDYAAKHGIKHIEVVSRDSSVLEEV